MPLTSWKGSPQLLLDAVKAQDHDKTAWLLEHGADPNDQDGLPLWFAVGARSTIYTTLILLLDHGADPNRAAVDVRLIFNSEITTPPLLPLFFLKQRSSALEHVLSVTLKQERNDKFKYLLSSNGNPNLRTSSGHPLLIACVKNRMPDLVRILLSHPDLQINTSSNEDGETALSTALLMRSRSAGNKKRRTQDKNEQTVLDHLFSDGRHSQYSLNKALYHAVVTVKE